MAMVTAKFLSSAKSRSFGKRPSYSLQDDIPLSRMDTTLPLQDSVNEDNNADAQQVRNHWYFLCYFLHGFLVALHLVVLVISMSNHAERRITILFDNELFTTALSGGLQAFYTLYTALLVFVTQSLVLSAIFSSPKKLTHIHDICGAWSGLGAALSALWSQAKVTSSVLSIGLVTVYFACVSVLHVTSSTIMQLQAFNDTVTRVVPAVATWPGPSVNLSSLDWMAVTTLVPFVHSLYGNTTNGLANNTLYDVPTQSFVNATVNATMLNAHCGLLTNISIDAMDVATHNISFTVSMTNLDPFSIRVSYPPLLNEIWFAPSITLECLLTQNCNNMILYLVSAVMETDDPVNGVNPIYLNGSFILPDLSGGATQNFMTPIYFVACSLDATIHMVTLDPSGNQPDLAKQPANEAWSNFSPGGNVKLTSGISSAMNSANSLPSSPYCQPIMADSNLWVNITAFNAYMGSVLGMTVSPCNGTTLAQHTTPSLLTRGQVEGAVSQIATEFIWLAGELGNVGGGFDRQTEECHITEYVLQWRLNINLLPVIAALSASVVLCAVVVSILWDHNTRPAAVSAAGVLEIMWLGSRSRMLRGHLRAMQNSSVDSLRASSMFETTFWTRSGSAQVHVNKESSGFYAAVPSDDPGSHTSSSRSLGSLEFASGDTLQSDNLYQHNPRLHAPDTSRSRHWCYGLHIVFAALHAILLVLLVHHPERSVVIPFESTTLTIGLSALLQAIYTLYSALLVIVMQRLALIRIVGEQRKLTTVHDVSGAWTGIGTAIYILWQQHQVPSSIREITAVVTYLSSMLVLHIGSSSVMQWQAFNNTLVGVLPSDLALPDNVVNIGKLGWVEIFPIAHSISQDTGVTTYGLSNSTLYDIPQVPINVMFSEASVNATTLNVQCGLVPLTLSALIPAFSYPSDMHNISFYLNGTNNGSFLAVPIWKDVVYSITPTTWVTYFIQNTSEVVDHWIPPCAACPQTLFYMITTGIDVDESVHDTVAVNMNWTYTPSGENPQISTTVTYIAACSVSARTVPATLNLQKEQLTMNTDQAALSTSTSWPVWSPGNATNLSVGMATALTKDISGSFPMFFQKGFPSLFTDMDSYMMYLLGLDLAYANATSASQSSASPSVTLSPSQLENAIAQTAARFLWVAGQLGESGGGYQRAVGESRVTRNALQWRLNLNTIPVVFASIASFTALILVRFIIGKRPSKEHPPLISGTSVLESLWLEAHSEVLHSRLKTIEEPRPDRLRAAGMLDISLGDIGRSSWISEAVGK